MADHMDSILKNGFTALEGYGHHHDEPTTHGAEHAEPLRVDEAVGDDFEAFQIRGIGADPVLIADRDPRRTKVQVQNLSDGFVYIGKQSVLTNVVRSVATGGAATGNGWRLGGSQSLSMEHTAPVYAVGDGTGILAVYIERDFS